MSCRHLPTITKSAAVLKRRRGHRIARQLLASAAIAGIGLKLFLNPGTSFAVGLSDNEAPASDAFSITPAIDLSMDIVRRGWPKNAVGSIEGGSGVERKPWSPELTLDGALIVPLHPMAFSPYNNIPDDGDYRGISDSGDSRGDRGYRFSQIRVSQKGEFAGRKVELLSSDFQLSPEVVASVVRDDQKEALTITISESVRLFAPSDLEAFVEVIRNRLSPFADGTPLPPSDKWIVLNARRDVLP